MTGKPIIEVHDLEVCYGEAVQAVRGISLAVPAGGFIALIGANGAGKTTLLRSLSGLVRLQRGRVTAGRILFDGADIAGRSPSRLATAGIGQVLEGRRCFLPMNVEENLRTATFAQGLSRRRTREALDCAYARFPRLAERRRTPAALLSGGEQQMLAMARALVGSPRLLLLDEPTMGLAPRIAEEILAGVARLNRDEGVAVLLAEQNAGLAVAHADTAHVIENGVIRLSATGAELAGHGELWAAYLGLPDAPSPVPYHHEVRGPYKRNQGLGQSR